MKILYILFKVKLYVWNPIRRFGVAEKKDFASGSVRRHFGHKKLFKYFSYLLHMYIYQSPLQAGLKKLFIYPQKILKDRYHFRDGLIP